MHPEHRELLGNSARLARIGAENGRERKERKRMRTAFPSALSLLLPAFLPRCNFLAKRYVPRMYDASRVWNFRRSVALFACENRRNTRARAPSHS
jgi:hypothetical protein